MARVVVVGAGVMGLAAAYQSLRNGHQTTLVEAAPEAGGMAAHFNLAGLSIERFYHFVCKADAPTFTLLEELGLGRPALLAPDLHGLFYRRLTLQMGRSDRPATLSASESDRKAPLWRLHVRLYTPQSLGRARASLRQGLDPTLVRRQRL